MKYAVFATILIIFISPVQADKWAILVGINDYENREISDLECAVSDVAAFKKALVEVAEFKSKNILLMTNESEGDKKPTSPNILYNVGDVSRKIDPEDTFIFYFSGHGMMRNGKAFLLSIEADPRDVYTLESRAVPVDKLIERMSKIKARQVLFIIDACRNDPEKGKGDVDNLLTLNFIKNVRAISVRAKKNSGTPSATAMLYACSKNQRAYEYYDKGQGAFSYFLVKGLCGEATDEDGNITVNKLANYVQEEVAKWAKKEGKEQTPWLDPESTGEIVLAKSPLVLLDISSKPYATIYVDNVYYGHTPHIAKIDLGTERQKKIEVALKRYGYKTISATIPARKGEKFKLTGIELERLHVPFKFREKDGMKTVCIYAGGFMMGGEFANEKPIHKIYLDAFYIDEHEVTNEQYCKFLNSIIVIEHEGNLLDLDGNKLIYCKFHIQRDNNLFKPHSERKNLPVAYVSWHGANEYAKWVGGRLPTEAEWEKAARGGGLVRTKYPNGNTISHDDANYGGTGGKDKWKYTAAPVKSFAPNGYGLYDMAGNVWEWCFDYWGADYYEKSPKDNPKGPASGRMHVVRGGSYEDGGEKPPRLCCGFRYRGRDVTPTVGFRVVMPAVEGVSTEPEGLLKQLIKNQNDFKKKLDEIRKELGEPGGLL